MNAVTIENCVDFIARSIKCHLAKIVVKVLKYNKTVLAKLKIFRKISTKNGKNSTFFSKYSIYKFYL